MRRSSSWLQNGCLRVVPVLRLGIHPEMERPAILNKSMPSTAGATMSNAAFQRFVTLSMRNAIYIFREKYTRWGAVFPGNFVPVLTCKGKCSCWRAKPAHFIGHLPVFCQDGFPICLILIVLIHTVPHYPFRSIESQGK